jgi:hypothetical protein
MLVEFSDARRNLLAQRRQVAAQRHRRANSIGTRGRAARSLGGVEDFAAVAISMIQLAISCVWPSLVVSKRWTLISSW